MDQTAKQKPGARPLEIQRRLRNLSEEAIGLVCVLDDQGGLDYLKSVVVDDSLGLAAELEAQMAHVVDTYQCEWKTAVNDPAVRQRFRSFVNSDKADEHIVFVEERGQIRPQNARERAQERVQDRSNTGAVQ